MTIDGTGMSLTHTDRVVKSGWLLKAFGGVSLRTWKRRWVCPLLNVAPLKRSAALVPPVPPAIPMSPAETEALGGCAARRCTCWTTACAGRPRRAPWRMCATYLWTGKSLRLF